MGFGEEYAIKRSLMESIVTFVTAESDDEQIKVGSDTLNFILY